jgi:hypothetical protein
LTAQFRIFHPKQRDVLFDVTKTQLRSDTKNVIIP